jgi:hypothetical protein
VSVPARPPSRSTGRLARRRSPSLGRGYSFPSRS